MNKQRIIFILMFIAATLVLGGCGGKEPQNTSEESTGREETDGGKGEAENGESGEEDESLMGDKNWIEKLKLAEDAQQIIVVAATGSEAAISMHTKDANGNWTELLSTPGHIGKNGVGKTKEGDKKTPRGVYRFLSAFGTEPDPGTALTYTQVDSRHYWVDDPDSAYYNRMVNILEVPQDFKSAEHLSATGTCYNYAMVTSYNEECTPGLGSAIFLHCEPTTGAGCIVVPQECMITILQNVHPDCVFLIDDEENIWNY